MNDRTETLSRYFMFLSLIGVLISIDQWTKRLVRTHIPFMGTWLPDSLSWLSPYARIIHWANSGAAFGSFQNGNPILIVLSFAVIVMLLYFYSHVDINDWSLQLAMGLYISGVTGNLIDRLMRGTVTDFISIGNFAVFNLADFAISLAVVIVILGALNKQRSMEQEKNLEMETGIMEQETGKMEQETGNNEKPSSE